jgi:Rieske 2Fe-2S family protein
MPEYNGLTAPQAGLPADWYFDAGHHLRELQQIWYRNWVYAGRSRGLEEAGSFRTVEVGDQRILLVRDAQEVLRAFHNTCRHRGAALCRETEGRLSGTVIICPYHAWVYSLTGELLRTPSSPAAGFEKRDHGLYGVAVTEWNGFIFIALSRTPPPFARNFDQPLERMAGWDLGALVVGHVFRRTVRCNWKIFWENYNECLHCPGVHPQLSQLVPIFGRGLLEERDDPRWRARAGDAHAGDEDPKYTGGLRRGAATWSVDGRPGPVQFANISDADRKLGHVYQTCLPSMFIVGHTDYVRVVSLVPLAPELTELRVEYLFAPEALAHPKFELRNVVDFANQVMSEDCDVCELNQRGLRALPHAHGVLMPEEYALQQLHEWVKAELQR